MDGKGFLRLFVIFIFALALAVCVPSADAQTKSPKGAKAIFDSGEGSSVRMSSGPAAPTATASAPRPEKFVGISYKIALMKPNGDFTIVPRSHTFRTGDRVKILVSTNRPGYLNIINIGSSGNTNMLFNDYIEARAITEIPKQGNFRFAGAPGTEKVLIMLSNNQNPFGAPQTQTASVQPPPAPSSAGALPPPPPGPSSAGALPPLPPPPSESLPPPPGPVADTGSTLPPPPPMMLANSMEGGKDIVLEDSMKTGFAVISPKNRYRPTAKGTKDIVLESDGGTNYGVVPAAALDDGGILTLDIKLNHR